MAIFRQLNFCETGVAFLAAVVDSGIMAERLATGDIALALLAIRLHLAIGDCKGHFCAGCTAISRQLKA